MLNASAAYIAVQKHTCGTMPGNSRQCNARCDEAAQEISIQNIFAYYFSFNFIQATVWDPMSLTISSAAYGLPAFVAARLMEFIR